jgi:hypothetical protein
MLHMMTLFKILWHKNLWREWHRCLKPCRHVKNILPHKKKGDE